MRISADANEETFTILECAGRSTRPLPRRCLVVVSNGVGVVGAIELLGWAVMLSQGPAVLELSADSSALIVESSWQVSDCARQVATVGKAIHCARKLSHELRRPDCYSTRIVWSLCNEIFCHMERAFSNSTTRNPSLKVISDVVEAKLPGRIRLEATASAVGLSPRELSALIRSECGCAFREYVLRKRLDDACYRIINTRQALGEIALQCGFADQAHFSREFKKIIGLSPSRYAKANCE